MNILCMGKGNIPVTTRCLRSVCWSQDAVDLAIQCIIHAGLRRSTGLFLRPQCILICLFSSGFFFSF